MYVIATFEHSIYVELAITSLEEKEIPKERILALTLDKPAEPRKLYDTIHHSDGFSTFDLSAIFGTVFMLLGSIYGYVLTWGPIIWGIIGAIFGSVSGFCIKYILLRQKQSNKKRFASNIPSEVIIMIRCKKEQHKEVK